MTTQISGRLVVALHGIEPATYEHCALIREWLADLGVEGVTLCLAAPPSSGSAFEAWLRERCGRGDVVRTAAEPPRAAATLGRWWRASGVPRRLRTSREPALVRFDIHPSDFDRHPRRTRAMERTLRRAAAHRRRAAPQPAAARLGADVTGVLGAP